MDTPKFNNRPNNRIQIKYQTSEGTQNHDYWIHRAPANVGVIFAVSPEGLCVLIVKRSNKMLNEPNKYGAPSGYLDWDESGYECMIREVYEETSFYLPDYQKFLKFDNNQNSFYTLDDPKKDKNQNVSRFFINVFDFYEDFSMFPHHIETFKCRETAEVKWMKVIDFYNNNNLEWAFNHDEKIRMALNFYNKH